MRGNDMAYRWHGFPPAALPVLGSVVLHSDGEVATNARAWMQCCDWGENCSVMRRPVKGYDMGPKEFAELNISAIPEGNPDETFINKIKKTLSLE